MGVALVGVAALSAGCMMKKQEEPPLTGPSELGTSLAIAISPDVITQDGASQALVTVTARDPSAQPIRNLSLNVEILFGGVRTDFGSLSARNLVTGSDGKATTVYTAPPAPAGPSSDSGTVVDIGVTPIGTNFGNALARTASLRLVPPGVVVPPDLLTPNFTISTTSPTDNQAVLFTACAVSACAPANNPIVSYDWDFGDGGTGSGKVVSHAYSRAATYVVRLTVTDAYGRSASASQVLTVAAAARPTADFEFSPTTPTVRDSVGFNASMSTATAPGSRIVSYTWDFGDGTALVTTPNVIVYHTFAAAKTYKVTLVVADDAGRTSLGKAKDVTILP